jgi:hypothetical protein
VGVDGLDQGAEHVDAGRERDDILAAKLVGERVKGEARDERAQLVQAHGERADLGLVRGAVAIVALKGLVGEHTAGDARVVAGQERGDANDS